MSTKPNDNLITVRIGDLFESDADTLVNTVNTEGVMGKGVALQFRKRFPDMYEDYVQRCKLHEVQLGKPYIYRGLLPPAIINFPTKQHWRSVSRTLDIEAGLTYLDEHLEKWGVTSIALPPLGCGEGGLEWRVVGRMIYRHAQKWGISVAMFAPFGTPEEQLAKDFLDEGRLELAPIRLPPAWVAVAEIVRRLERQPYHWPVGRIMFQKIAYFATVEGLPTNLEFGQGSFGPYANSATTMKTKLMNNGLLKEESPTGNMYHVLVGPQFEDALPSYEDDLANWSTHIDRVTDLFLRFDTTQAEIAATVHFAANNLVPRNDRLPTEEDVFRAVKDWKMKRRPPLKDEQIALMIRNLNMLGWLRLEASESLPLPAHVHADEFDLV